MCLSVNSCAKFTLSVPFTPMHVDDDLSQRYIAKGTTRRSAPVPVSQTEVRKSHLPGKCEGYATDSSDDGQLSHEPSSSLMSSSVRIPQRKLREKTEHEERLGLAASLEGSDSLQGFVPPHKMSMPSGNFLDLSSRPVCFVTSHCSTGGSTGRLLSCILNCCCSQSEQHLLSI